MTYRPDARPRDAASLRPHGVSVNRLPARLLIGFERVRLSPHDLANRQIVSERRSHAVAEESRIGERPFRPSPRFWSSVAANYGLGASPWRYFSPTETFARIAAVHPDHGLRFAFENHGGEGKDLLLGITRSNKPVVPYSGLLDLVQEYEGEDSSYCDGRVISFHRPTAAEEFAIAGDQFCPRFMLSAPVDGYGKPAVYLCVLRAVCRNGLVAYANAFQSQLAVGKQADSVVHSIARALDSYSNDEGYAAWNAAVRPVIEQNWPGASPRK